MVILLILTVEDLIPADATTTAKLATVIATAMGADFYNKVLIS